MRWWIALAVLGCRERRDEITPDKPAPQPSTAPAPPPSYAPICHYGPPDAAVLTLAVEVEGPTAALGDVARAGERHRHPLRRGTYRGEGTRNTTGSSGAESLTDSAASCVIGLWSKGQFAYRAKPPAPK
jgi:hypothetical protein